MTRPLWLLPPRRRFCGAEDPDGWPLLAVALGGGDPNTILIRPEGRIPARPPVVHMLELSTGRELHALEGLTNPGAADFDGDGLADLWGEFRGQLAAFQGEAPEAWRALGNFHTAQTTRISGNDTLTRSFVDFNGDRVADALSAGLSYAAPFGSAGNRTAICRSGTDGRVIWKSVLDSDDSLKIDRFCVFPLPEGDFDGDGTPDVIVQSGRLTPAAVQSKPAATLPLNVLSGRTGAHLFKAGPLPLGFQASGYSRIQSIQARTIEPRGAPDLLVRHDDPFAVSASKAGLPGVYENQHLARVSGRNGRIVWDIELVEGTEIRSRSKPSSDGALDSVFLIPPQFRPGRRPAQLAATSLLDGKQLWSTSLETSSFGTHVFAVDDLDGDGHPEIVLMRFEYQTGATVTAFEGRDGSRRWTWSAASLANRNPDWLWPTSTAMASGKFA